jgi:predicted nucleic acid-binding protein
MAEDLIGHKDPKDVPFLALALSVGNEGILTGDKHFTGLVCDIRIWNPAELERVISQNLSKPTLFQKKR